ncbi:MAG: inositol monophosphatase family protein [Limnospira sp.]
MTEFGNQIFAFAETTAGRVGEQLLRDFGAVQAEAKSDGSLVTRSDRWADGEIRDAIARTFPNHGILSEEGEHIFPPADWCWIIDPLDGTTNFTRGIPIWGISIALLYRGTPLFGYIHLPPLQQTFHGFWQGSSALDVPTGSFGNGIPIRPTADVPGPNQFFNLCSRSVALAPHLPAKVRMLGMATYNFLTVAAGTCIGGVEATPKIWDIAAAWAIVRASGAVWVPLDSAEIFPLKSGFDYGDRSFPTLVASQTQWLDTFEPLAESKLGFRPN